VTFTQYRHALKREGERAIFTVRSIEQMPWRIAAARSKNGLTHEIALTEAMLAVIQSMPRVRNKAGYLFSTNGTTPCSGFSRAKARLDKLMLEYAKQEAAERGDKPSEVRIEPWRIHDLRRTVASGMARLGIALPVIEKCLNHVSGSFAGIVGVYQRHTFTAEKRAAFEAWTRHVEAIVNDAQSTNIGSQQG
jgi:integrase